MATVIAELCQNFNGDREILRDMIWSAAQAGADYVKVQAIFARDLSFRERFEEGVVEDGHRLAIKRPYAAEYDRLKPLEFPLEDYDWYIEECASAGTKPLVTAFTREQVEDLAKFPFEAVKVASYDCASLPLLRDLRARFSRLFVSTGATLDEEVKAAASELGGSSFSFLHCVTIYPTPLDELHLSRMEYLRQFTDSVGFSDHTSVTEGIAASAVALMLGADVIERHFTVLEPTETRDGPVSIGPELLERLCGLAHTEPARVEEYVAEHVGDYSAMMGSPQRELSHEEMLNRDYYRGRFASRASGETIFNWEERPLP